LGLFEYGNGAKEQMAFFYASDHPRRYATPTN